MSSIKRWKWKMVNICQLGNISTKPVKVVISMLLNSFKCIESKTSYMYIVVIIVAFMALGREVSPLRTWYGVSLWT